MSEKVLRMAARAQPTAEKTGDARAGNTQPLPERPAWPGGAPTVTVVVPTYKEVESLPHLIDRIGKVRAASGVDIDVLLMDDNSRDGSVELVAARPERWVQIVVRTGKRGLSEAVLDGLPVVSVPA